MPATVSSRFRKADASHQSEPAAKKQRLDSSSSSKSISKSHSRPASKSLGDALLPNGTAKKLEAKSGKVQPGKSAHAVNDAKSSVGTTIGQRGDLENEAVIEISDDSDSDEEEDEEEAEQEAEPENDGHKDLEETKTLQLHADPVPNGVNDNDEDEDMEDDEDEEPTFGEMLSAAPIDVQSALQRSDDDEHTLQALQRPSSSRTALSSTTTSLATVLSQALKTNDRALLETCFMTNDLASVRSTIQRLPSSQVSALLHHIADKMHKRPGRASNLMVWIQWSLVSHGGYLARRKDIVRKLGALNRVIKERANGLQPLLVLKGKLDMLAAQLELRREMMQANKREMDDDEDVVIYVEGQEDDGDVKKDGDADSDEEEEDDAEVDLDSRIVAQGLDDQDDSEADDDDSDKSSDDEEVSDAGFSDQELDEQDSASDLVNDDSEDDDDEDEDEEETLAASVSQGKKKRKA